MKDLDLLNKHIWNNISRRVHNEVNVYEHTFLFAPIRDIQNPINNTIWASIITEVILND